MPALAIHGGAPVRTEPWTPDFPLLAHLVDAEVAAAERVIRSRNLCAQHGHEVEEFEQAFAAYLGVRHAVATSSGTTALQVAFAALGVEAGVEVIVPSYTFCATATAVQAVGGAPVFADCEPRVQGVDLDHVRALVTPRTRAIAVTHMNGFPMDMDPLMAFARERGLAVVEDCSHAHGAEYHGRKVGAIGRVNGFSFQQKKNLPLGEGGMATTDDDALAERLRGFRSFGPVRLGCNYRMTELHAAIGKIRLPDLDAQNALRIRNAERLAEGLAGVPGLTVQTPLPDTRCVYYNFLAQVDEAALGVTKARFCEAVQAEGVTLRTGYPAAHRLAFFQGIESRCPRVEEFCGHRNVELKLHPPAGEADMDDAAAAIRKVAEHARELREG